MIPAAPSGVSAIETVPDAFLRLAERMADAAAAVTLGYFRKPIAIDDKADASPVTIADKESEDAMRRMIADAFPDHGIVGEERGDERDRAEYVWVLDPIDGTKSFVTGKPLFGTLIALLKNDRPILGIIDHPALKERFVGVAGRPSTWNGKPIRVRPCPKIADAWLYATTPEMFRPGEETDGFDRLKAKVKHPVYGAECYAYGLLSAGLVDIVCEATMKPVDYCAVVPVVEGAGGTITDWQGRPLGLRSTGQVLAAGDGAVHKAAMAALAG